jgi:hypothetical protein
MPELEGMAHFPLLLTGRIPTTRKTIATTKTSKQTKELPRILNYCQINVSQCPV